MSYPFSPTSVGLELYSALAPLVREDPDNGYHALILLEAFGQMFQPIEDLARDTADREGWASLLDPDTIPAAGLPWLAQFVGVRLPNSLDEIQKRARIKATDGFRRGTPAALRAAAEAHLTDPKRIIMRERDTSPYHLTVYTYQDETPDSDWRERENRVTNPSFETALTHWVATVGGSVERSQDWSDEGDWSARWHGNQPAGQPIFGGAFDWNDFFPVTPGESISVRAIANIIDAPASGTWALSASFWDHPGATYLGQEDIAVSSAILGEHEVINEGIVVPANADYVWLRFVLPNNPGTWDFYLDGIHVEGSAEFLGYGDGARKGWEWAGAAHNSGSERLMTSIVRDALLEQKPAGLILDHVVIPDLSYATLRGEHADYADVEADYTDYEDIIT